MVSDGMSREALECEISRIFPYLTLFFPAMFGFWDQLGVFIFAVSGALAGRARGMDYFGMFVVGLITGTGGGTLRSVLIGDTPPPILQSPNYLLIAIATETLSIATIRIPAICYSLNHSKS